MRCCRVKVNYNLSVVQLRSKAQTGS